jgi:hypothetical protein
MLSAYVSAQNRLTPLQCLGAGGAEAVLRL